MSPSEHPHPPLRAEFEFPLGLPAFETERRFELVQNPEFAPLALLRSAARPSLQFVCAPLTLIDASYRADLAPDEIEVLGGGGALLFLAILTFVPEGPPTANLLAPVVLNPSTGRGLQSIQSGAEYSPQHPLRERTPCL